MDLSVQRSAEPGAPSLRAYDRDHINALLKQLATVDERLGVTLPKSRLSAGIVNVDIPSDKLVAAATLLRDELGFDMLSCVSGVDMIDHIESIYHFRSIAQGWLLQARVRLTADHPEVDSLVGLYPGANWLEREQYDMYGIIYRGHPDLRRILLEDEFIGHPLLKSFNSTPIVRHDRATTQAPAVQAVAGENLRHQERVQTKRLNQGTIERIHPGMTTLGGAAVYLETGQGVEPGPTPEGRYLAETSESEAEAEAESKPQKRG
ncbi:MAG TPA: NADH-quinone oxidoreductase subunit C [Ktedonobacterales bacterium]